MALHLTQLMKQFRARRSDLEDLEELAAKQKSHRQRLLTTTRKIHMIYASLLVGCAECLPQAQASTPCGKENWIGVLQGSSFAVLTTAARFS